MLETWGLCTHPDQEQGGASHNHPNFGSIGEWFFEYLAGIQPDEERPGFKHFTVRPHIPESLDWAGAEYRSVHGLIRSRWEKRGGLLALDITVPANTTATVHVPSKNSAWVTESGRPAAQAEGVRFLRQEENAAVFEVGSGSYHFKQSPK